MTGRLRREERIDLDLGPVPSMFLSVGLAILAAIGASALTAIGLAIAFELAPTRRGLYGELRIIGASSQFAAEVAWLFVLLGAYRKCRGLRLLPGRLSIFGLMVGIALLGVVAARFLALPGRHVLG
jgi:hypothetical protein